MLDLRLVNANVLTMDAARPAARELGIWRGRIVGLDEQLTTLPAARTVDLDGATVLPGFVDAHVHLAWTGVRAGAANVAPCRRTEDVLTVIERAAGQRPAGEWVDIVGYDQRPLRRHLTASELDTVSAGRKVFVVHDSGHACVVDSSVLALLPLGVEHDDGLLAEQGMAAVRRLRQPYPIGELVDAIERAGRTCLAEGVTAAAEAGIGGGLVSHSPVELAAYQQAHEQGRLPIRVRLMVAGGALRPAGAHESDGIPRAIDLGMRTGFGGERLALGAMKVFTDGGMMARTAAVTSPYAGTDNLGQLFDDPRELTALIVDGHRAGWQLAVHAIGDRAVDVTLDALGEARRRYPRSGTRHRVEHAGLVRPDQLARFAEVGATGARRSSSTASRWPAAPTAR
jgi:predicted amidohydrolase YtcJ